MTEDERRRRELRLDATWDPFELHSVEAPLREVVTVTVLDARDGRLERKLLTLSRAKWEELRALGKGVAATETYLVTKAAAELFGVDLEKGVMSRGPLPGRAGG